MSLLEASPLPSSEETSVHVRLLLESAGLKSAYMYLFF